MLRNIAKLATHYPQTKTSQRFASQLNSRLRELHEKINEAGSTPNPIPKLREVRISPLYGEIQEMLEEVNPEIMKQPFPHLTPELRTVAHAFTLCHALDGVTSIMCDHFNLKPSTQTNGVEADKQDARKANDLAFQEQIKPEFEEELKSTFRLGWNKFNPAYSNKGYPSAPKELEKLTRMAGVLSVVAPDVLADFDVSYPKEALELARKWGDIPPEMQLNKSELLALIDYVNSTTSTFNASTGVALARDYYGQKVLPVVMQVFTTALSGAIEKLCAHPYFGRADIKAYKGLKLNDPAGHFRLGMLEAAVGNGKLIPYPQILSATSNIHLSYAATKYHEGYHYECEFTLKKACDVDIFHDTHTKGEMEVIAPAGQKFIVTEKKPRDVPDMDTGGVQMVTQFVLVPAEKSNF